ncbi:protease modulator HflC [Tropicimonas sp. IMCC34011]|uniref:protease modulator HflC n=1 Tax=Tropicimonas sp. IMCC34011 TaxID=2248759 RepID=UPI000E235418|nr:protease modulator HflC [Tropicimonas sp. IMCC34011]
MGKAAISLIVAVVILVVVASSSLFIVDEREKALVLQFGQIKDVKEEPGLAFKIPLIQEVVRYDDRILALDTDTIEVTPSDDRRLVVDAFARYRISDVIQFRQAVGVGGERAAEDRLEGILNPQIRAVLGSDGVTSNTILSADRSDLMNRITEQARARAEPLGLYVIDVRLKQTNLPSQNLDATFARMRAEREREAADEIARGEEAAQRVRAQADRTVVELVSEAQREAQIVRGEAEAERTRITADAYTSDRDYFDFSRSLEAMETALGGENSSMVITPNNEFFTYLNGTGALPDIGPDAGTDAAAGDEEDAAAGTVEGADTGVTLDAAPASGDAEADAPEADAPEADDAETGTDAEASEGAEEAPAPEGATLQTTTTN